MIAILLAIGLSLILSLVGTPLVIRFFQRREMGQLIRDDGPKSHQTKRGTPTMGGVAIILSTLVAYFIATAYSGELLNPGGLLVVGTFVAMGAVGFIDDGIKLINRRNLGLSSKAKFLGQAIVALFFSFGAQYVADTSTQLSFIGPLPFFDFGPWLYPFFCFLILAATSNAVNLTDGLDGLAAGTSAMVFGAYCFIAYWISRHGMLTPGCVEGCIYTDAATIHADVVAIAAGAAMGATIGFLWWNAHPAHIFMGDTGSLAIGGMLAALAVVTETELLLILLGGLFVVETLSVIIQVLVFRFFGGRRVFKMAPIHHHFEHVGWHENQVIVRFWILCALFVSASLGVFYADWLARL